MNKINRFTRNAFIVFLLYFLYVGISTTVTNKLDPGDLTVVQTGFQVFGFYFWYVYMPLFALKKMRHLFGSSTAIVSAASPLPLDLATDNSG